MQTTPWWVEDEKQRDAWAMALLSSRGSKVDMEFAGFRLVSFKEFGRELWILFPRGGGMRLMTGTWKNVTATLWGRLTDAEKAVVA